MKSYTLIRKLPMVVYSRIRRDETISTNILIIAIIIFLVLIFRVKINFLVFICFEWNIRSSIFTKLDKIGPVVNSSVKSDGICLRDQKKKLILSISAHVTCLITLWFNIYLNECTGTTILKQSLQCGKFLKTQWCNDGK